MYHIRRPNRGEEGPHSAETLRVWLQNGGLEPGCEARLEGSDEWRPILAFPEFAPAASPAVPPPLPTIPPARLPAPAVDSRTSFLAALSFALGLVGIFGITGIVGLICGFIALGQIRRSNGALKGRWLARLGIFCSSLMLALLVGGFVLAIMMNRAQRAGGWRQSAPNDCISSLSQLGYAIHLYANDHADLLPASTNWCDSVRDYTPSMGVFICPNTPSPRRCSFAFNSALGGRNLDELNPQTVLLFESDADWNGAGGPELVASKGSEGGYLVVCFANGGTQKVSRSALAKLRWKP